VRALVLVLAAGAAGCAPRAEVVVGSKKFTEGVILGEMLAQLARETGATVHHRRELGGTRVLWSALVAGEIDAYVEYTGTLRQEIFAGRDLAAPAALEAALAAVGVRMSRPIGFDNTYALGMREETAEALGVRRISDLARHPELRFGFGNEFLDRGDGWPSLASSYGFEGREVSGMDHDLAYRGLAAGDVEVMDLYATDAEIAYYGLRVLEDDRGHFPSYAAVVLWRADLERRRPAVVAALRRLEGRIDDAAMTRLNARAKIEREPEARVAAGFLDAKLGVASRVVLDSLARRLALRAREHLFLVAVSLAAAVLVGVPLGILAALREGAGRLTLGFVGVLQTIPSLVLFVLFIPYLGIGTGSAIAALFLYSLLPIVRGTYSGLAGVPRELRDSATALGLSRAARLTLVELPMATRSILSGIQTSAVINVGTATLGALIGAGGFGQPILTGIRLDDLGLVFEGAIPAALLAVGVQGLFEVIERWLLPRGLRLAGEAVG